MSSPWIKVEHTTPYKPEVIRMAALLRMDPDAVVGKLLRLWIWVDQHSVDGQAVPITTKFIDQFTNKRGFAEAMRTVVWLTGEDGALTFPNFDNHNGDSAKARAQTSRRVAKHRQNHDNGNAPTVTPPPPEGTAPVTPPPLAEKRREEENISLPPPAGAQDSVAPPPTSAPPQVPATAQPRPTLAEAKAAAGQIGITEAQAEEWWLARESSGWTKSAGAPGTTLPVGANWHADAKTYTNRRTQGRADESAQSTPPSRTHAADLKHKTPGSHGW